MQLRQQIIRDRTDSLASHLGIGADQAFLRLAHSLVTGKSVQPSIRQMWLTVAVTSNST